MIKFSLSHTVLRRLADYHGKFHPANNNKNIRMKAIVLFSLVMLAISAKSQSLKEALYGGKLKADTGAVIRKGDSLKIQENMAQKIVEDSIKKSTADSVRKEAIAAQKEKAIAAGEDTTGVTDAVLNPPSSTEPLAPENALPKDNNKIWKAYIDSLSITIKSEVLSSGKIKKGNYFVLIDYKINPDGQISVTSVTTDPQNSYLEQNIKDRLTLDSPRLNPVIDANGRARTVNKKQTLNFVK